MTRQRVPTFAATPDWPRKVASALAATQNDIEALQSDITAVAALTDWSTLGDYADDTAAAAASVAVGALYRTGSIVKVRVS